MALTEVLFLAGLWLLVCFEILLELRELGL
jgi:hypothetical protein